MEITDYSEGHIFFEGLITLLNDNDSTHTTLNVIIGELNDLVEEGKKVFCEALEKNNTLIELRAEQNIIDEGFMAQINQALEKNYTLTVFKFDKSLISEQSALTLDKHLERNKKLALTTLIVPQKVDSYLADYQDASVIQEWAFQAAQQGDVNKLYTFVSLQPELLTKLDERSRSLLHVASWYGQINGVKLLLQMGANVNMSPPKHWTPLHDAVNRNHIVIAQILLTAGADISLNSDGFTPLHYIQDVEMAKLLFAHRAALKANGIEKAGTENYYDTVIASVFPKLFHLKLFNDELLIFLQNQHIDINARLEGGISLLHSFIHLCGDIPPKEFSIQLNRLIKEGANPLATDDKNRMPLHWAKSAKVKNVDIIEHATSDYFSIKMASIIFSRAREKNHPLFFNIPDEIGTRIAKSVGISNVLNKETCEKIASENYNKPLI